jgi:hypothetical protein
VSFISGAMYSYADLTGPGALGLLGCALDADPDLRAVKAGHKGAATAAGGVQRRGDGRG